MGGQASQCGGCWVGLLGALPTRQRASSWQPRTRSECSIGDQVEEELQANGSSSSRIESTLRLWKSRGGSSRRLEDFYEHVERLGQGAFGSVDKWRCRASPTSASDSERHCYAVKQIRWQKVWHGRWRNKEVEESIRQELRTFISLDHPNIATIREWFEDTRDGIFFVMELCEGGSMQDVLEDDVCKESSIAARMKFAPRLQLYFRELLYAVSYIHSKGVVHRDLKPENVMLRTRGPDSSIKLIDFGLATLAEGEGEGELWQQGTMVFMAPEFFLNATGRFTEKSDMWSLGVMLAWIASALHLGSLQHPILPPEDGEGFSVRWPDLHGAFRDAEPWHEEYFASMPGPCVELAGRLLVYEAEDRASAAPCLDSPWVSSAATESWDLLKSGAAIANLKSFGRLSALERNLLSMVASNLNYEQQRQLEKAFEALDADNKGRLSRENLLEGFGRCGFQATPEEVDELLEMYGGDGGTDAIDYHDFLAAAIGSRMVMSEDVADKVFHSLDSECSGKLRTEQFSPLAGGCGESEEQMNRFFSRRTSGTLTQDEFKEVVREISKKRRTLSGTEAAALVAQV